MIVLASQSPRRKRLLAALGVDFEVRPVDLDESSRPNEKAEDFVLRMACEKARAFKDLGDQADGKSIIGSDTVVVLDNKILGKPIDRQDATRMLGKLSGRTHVVFTGVCVMGADGKEHTDLVQTPVTFRKLTGRDIEAYLDTDEAYDKAGAYAIQGGGAALVDRIEGSYTNVVGLPVAETLSLLKKAGSKL